MVSIANRAGYIQKAVRNMPLTQEPGALLKEGWSTTE
jgi:hypothetical protein